MDKVDTYDKEQLQAMGWLFDETETPNPTYVSVYSPQNFSMSEQAQARANIGIQSADELLADDDFIASLKTKLGL